MGAIRCYIGDLMKDLHRRDRVKIKTSGVPSSVKLQIITRVQPAKMPGRMSGSVTRRKTVHRPRQIRRRLLHRRIDVGRAA